MTKGLREEVVKSLSSVDGGVLAQNEGVWRTNLRKCRKILENFENLKFYNFLYTWEYNQCLYLYFWIFIYVWNYHLKIIDHQISIRSEFRSLVSRIFFFFLSFALLGVCLVSISRSIDALVAMTFEWVITDYWSTYFGCHHCFGNC